MKARFIYEAFEKRSKEESTQNLLYPGRMKLLKKHVKKITQTQWLMNKREHLEYFSTNMVNSDGEEDAEDAISYDNALKKFASTVFSNNIVEIFRYYSPPDFYNLIMIKNNKDEAMDFYEVNADVFEDREDFIYISNNIDYNEYNKVFELFINKKTGFMDIFQTQSKVR